MARRSCHAKLGCSSYSKSSGLTGTGVACQCPYHLHQHSIPHKAHNSPQFYLAGSVQAPVVATPVEVIQKMLEHVSATPLGNIIPHDLDHEKLLPNYSVKRLARGSHNWRHPVNSSATIVLRSRNSLRLS